MDQLLSCMTVDFCCRMVYTVTFVVIEFFDSVHQQSNGLDSYFPSRRVVSTCPPRNTMSSSLVGHTKSVRPETNTTNTQQGINDSYMQEVFI